MTDFRRYESIYKQASSPEQLFWHRGEEDIPSLLTQVAQKRGGGKALDLGCGTGIHSIYLAKMGFQVTSLDFVAKALEWARDRANKEGVNIEFIQADITEWHSSDSFDLIFDSGCLHSFADLEKRRIYKQRLLEWLDRKGDYILIHFCKRNWLDWRPVGPCRYKREKILRFFGPELVEQGFTSKLKTGLGFPMGPSVEVGKYWFRQVSE